MPSGWFPTVKAFFAVAASWHKDINKLQPFSGEINNSTQHVVSNPKEVQLAQPRSKADCSSGRNASSSDPVFATHPLPIFRTRHGMNANHFFARSMLFSKALLRPLPPKRAMSVSTPDLESVRCFAFLIISLPTLIRLLVQKVVPWSTLKKLTIQMGLVIPNGPKV